MRVKFTMVHARADADDVLVYGLTPAACSACAPRTIEPHDVIAAVSKQLGVKLEAGDRYGPTLCARDGGRVHWFLVYNGNARRKP